MEQFKSKHFFFVNTTAKKIKERNISVLYELTNK